MGYIDQVNAEIIGSQDSTIIPSLYVTTTLKPNMTDDGNILTQVMVGNEKTKYVIKWSYDLQGETITIPEHCLIEFDGGSFTNGTLVGQDTILIYHQQLSDVLTATLDGTFIYPTDIHSNG